VAFSFETGNHPPDQCEKGSVSRKSVPHSNKGSNSMTSITILWKEGTKLFHFLFYIKARKARNMF